MSFPPRWVSSTACSRRTSRFFSKNLHKRGSLDEIATEIRGITKDYAYARPALRFPNALGGRDTFSPIRASLLGPEISTLMPLSKELVGKLLKEPPLADIRANLNFNNPELQVVIDRQLASDLGVRVSDVASAVRLLMSGEDEISNYKEAGEQYPVTMRLLPGQRDDPQVLSRLLVPSAKLGLIRLDSIAKLERGLGPSRIDRVARQYGIGIYGNMAPGHALGEGAEVVQRIVEEMNLPAGLPASVLRASEDPGRNHRQHAAGYRLGIDLHVYGSGGSV